METLSHDLRFGFRRLIKTPGFAVIAVLSLALGIGANTAIFSLVNLILFRPLPVASPKEVVSVSAVGKDGEFDALSYPNYLDFRDRNEVLSGLLAYRFTYMSLSRNGNNEKVWGYLVSGNYFDTLGVKPALGRTFLPEEDKTRLSHPVVVISHSLWRTRFGGDPSVVDSDVLINGRKFKVIGVAPAGFKGTEVIYTPEIYVPLAVQKWIEPESNYLDRRDASNLFAVGRLKPGVSAARAEASLNLLAAQLAKDFPNENEGLRIKVVPPGFVLPQIRNQMLSVSAGLMGLVAMVLLIACVNLANLLLARATERGKEIAVRLSVGASRARIVRQFLTESVMLAAVGGLVGIALAQWIIDSIMALKPPIDIPVTLEPHVDWRVLVFSMAIGRSPLVTAQLPGRGAGRGIADSADRRRFDTQSIAATARDESRLRPRKRLDDELRPEPARLPDRRRHAASQAVARSRRVVARRAIGFGHRFHTAQHELQQHGDSDRRPSAGARPQRAVSDVCQCRAEVFRDHRHAARGRARSERAGSGKEDSLGRHQRNLRQQIFPRRWPN
jgi:predicted permease